MNDTTLSLDKQDPAATAWAAPAAVPISPVENGQVSPRARLARGGLAAFTARIFSVRFLLGLLLPIGFLLGIELLVKSGITPAHLLPAPSTVFGTLTDLAKDGLGTHLVASVLRVLAGFVIGAGLGLVVAVAVGLSLRLEQILDPSFQALRAVPSLAWVPLLLLWLGIDETPKITLIAIGAFFPVYLNVVSGLRNVDRKLVELGEIYGLSRFALARRILLPAALPAIFTGLRTSLSLAWMFLVAAELIAATRGLGYLLTDGRETSRPDIVIAAILLLALLGKFSDGALKQWETRALRWRDSFDERLEADKP